MNALLKNDHSVDTYIDKRMVMDSLDLMDAQLRWMEQKLTVRVDNIIHDQFMHFEEDIKELELKINKQLCKYVRL